MSIDTKQLRELVVRPTLKQLGLWSSQAEALILETIAVESAMGSFLKQVGSGPALGISQVEPKTFAWLLKALSLRRNPKLWLQFKLMFGLPKPEQLVWDLRLAVAMCRLRYMMDSQPIPTSRVARARYWKRVYNTEAGAGTPEKYLLAWADYGDDVD